MAKNIKILTGITVLLIAILFSCSKARIEKPVEEIINNNQNEITELLKFVPLDNYFSSKAKEAEIFNFTFPYTPTQYYPRTTEGTIIASTKVLFTTLSDDTIDYPYIISINEFYKLKDVIYTNRQLVYNNKLLSLFGMYNIRFSKNGSPLKLKTGKTYSFYSQYHTTEIASDSLPIFIGNDWSMSNNEFIGDSTYFYGYLNITGWLLFGKETNFNASNYTTLNFTSNKYDLTNVGIYIVFSDKNTFTRVQNQESINLPVGEQAKLVAFGITEKGKLYSYSKEIIIGEETSYSIDLTTTNDAFLTSMLDSL